MIKKPATWRRALARLLGVQPEQAPKVRVEIRCPHGAFIPAQYDLTSSRQTARLSCDRCPMLVTLSWSERAAMLDRRERVLHDHPEVVTTEQLAPLMGDMEPAYWDWVLGRVAAGEVPATEVPVPDGVA